MDEFSNQLPRLLKNSPLPHENITSKDNKAGSKGLQAALLPVLFLQRSYFSNV
jgi:hypothetical protein